MLGPDKGKGNEMAKFVLKSNGQVVPRRTNRSLRVAEIYSPVEIKKKEEFTNLTRRRWGIQCLLWSLIQSRRLVIMSVQMMIRNPA